MGLGKVVRALVPHCRTIASSAPQVPCQSYLNSCTVPLMLHLLCTSSVYFYLPYWLPSPHAHRIPCIQEACTTTMPVSHLCFFVNAISEQCFHRCRSLDCALVGNCLLGILQLAICRISTLCNGAIPRLLSSNGRCC